jgi:hypothetical protein
MSDDSQRLIDEMNALCESIEGYAVVSERLSFQLLMIREALQSGVYEGNYNDSDYLQV